jgi:hypothetical protein
MPEAFPSGGAQARVAGGNPGQVSATLTKEVFNKARAHAYGLKSNKPSPQGKGDRVAVDEVLLNKASIPRSKNSI